MSLKRPDDGSPWTLCRRPWTVMYRRYNPRGILQLCCCSSEPPCTLEPRDVRGAGGSCSGFCIALMQHRTLGLRLGGRAASSLQRPATYPLDARCLCRRSETRALHVSCRTYQDTNGQYAAMSAR
jgi:hypothetical protein